MPSRNNYSERLDLTTSIENEYGQGAVLFLIWIFKRYIFNILKVSDDNNLIMSIPFIFLLIFNEMWGYILDMIFMVKWSIITYLPRANLIHFQSPNLVGCGKLNRNVNVRVYDIVVSIYTFRDTFCRSNVWIGILIDICITSFINRCYTQDVIHSKYLRFKNQYPSCIISIMACILMQIIDDEMSLSNI